MSLVKDDLLSNIWDVIQRAGSGSINIDPNLFPTMPEPLAQAFAEAYDKYAAAATAGSLSVVTKGSIDKLKTNMMQPNLTGWAAGVGIYWGDAVFGGDPFYVEDNRVTTDSGTKTIESIGAAIPIYLDLTTNPPPRASVGADRLATLLHNGTTKLVIQTTTSDSSGTLGTQPIS